MAKTHLTMGMLPLEHRNRHRRRKRGIVNRQIGVKNFIRVVTLDPRTKGHMMQRRFVEKVGFEPGVKE